jgi:uncharacterized protein YcbK (DUF882 family)
VPPFHRRDFLKLSLGIIAGSLFPYPAFGYALEQVECPRTLSFYNIHTGEELSVCYHENGIYQPEALVQINHILRDFRTDDIVPINPGLLNLLYQIRCRTEKTTPFHVISGYRSPKTNEMLRQITSGVAKNSLHTKGEAIDIRLPGFSTRYLRDVCINLRAGGVGFYPKSDFVHVDIGNIRYW